MSDPVAGPATTIAAAVRSGERSARSVVEASLAAVAAGDGDVHAFLEVLADDALAAADRIDAAVAAGEDPGPLAGVPVALKDNLCTRGVPTTCSSRILEGWRPPYDATVVDRLRGGRRGRRRQDQPRRVRHGLLDRELRVRADAQPVGPSAGCPAAPRAGRPPRSRPGFVPLALGSDTGGSIRQPAALCGVVGMKPTYGTVSRYGLIAFASSLDQIGPFAATVADAALLLEVIAGHDPCDSHLARRAGPGRLRDRSVPASTGCGSASVAELRRRRRAATSPSRSRQAADALAAAGATIERGLDPRAALRPVGVLPDRPGRGVVQPRPLRRRPLRPARRRRRRRRDEHAPPGRPASGRR